MTALSMLADPCDPNPLLATLLASIETRSSRTHALDWRLRVGTEGRLGGRSGIGAPVRAC